MRQPEYKIYPSLLDSFTQWVRSDDIYDQYWGFSENPPHSPEEFRKIQFDTLIDRINRVPMKWEDSEAADRGTALNEVVDCLVDYRRSTKCTIEKVYEKIVNGLVDPADGKVIGGDVEETNEVIGLEVTYNKRTFYFDIRLVRELAGYFKDALTQQYIQATLDTDFGPVLLYGYTDYVSPFAVHDLKTTGKYTVGKYRHNSQHLVYPFILRATGNDVSIFEYNVAELAKTSYATYTETYAFTPERDIPVLRRRVEDFIRFVNDNRNLITDKKIFNNA